MRKANPEFNIDLANGDQDYLVCEIDANDETGDVEIISVVSGQVFNGDAWDTATPQQLELLRTHLDALPAEEIRKQVFG
jgi:hypothetical protein